MPLVTVFVPLMHVQVAPPIDLCDYAFQIGAQISTRKPTEVWDAIEILKRPDSFRWTTDIELNSLVAARGWLWVQQEIEHAAGYEFRELIAERLVRPIGTLLKCIHLSGAGENTHWAFGSFQDIWRIYVETGFVHANNPFRIERLHSLPTTNTAAWSSARMSTAEELLSALTSYEGLPIPRLALAFNSYITLAGLHPTEVVERNLRFQIAITALETFYIAPTEKKHIWSDEIQSRLVEVCDESSAHIAEICELIRDARNDVVHRAGLQDSSTVNPTITDACAKAEKLLRLTLRWGILNQAMITEAFEDDQWPI